MHLYACCDRTAHYLVSGTLSAPTSCWLQGGYICTLSCIIRLCEGTSDRVQNALTGKEVE